MEHPKPFRKPAFSRLFLTYEQLPLIPETFRWLLICTVVGGLSGSLSALFLVSLDVATAYRETHTWIIWLLPVAGLLIGLTYHYLGKDVEGGNNLFIDEIHTPRKTIPLKMAPLVLISTIVTHLFGGSAGREGTAVQMGGSVADQFTRIFRLRPRDRQKLLIAGVSAGFASVFGTPLAGAVFGLEVFFMGRMRYDAILPAFLAAAIAHFTTTAWGVGHTHYIVPFIPELTPAGLLFTLLTGAIFGLTGMLFAKTSHGIGFLFKKLIGYAPLRPVAGGLLVAVAVWAMGTTRYIGLGIPTIVEAFEKPLPSSDFLLKILFTAVTLGSGFKGGEVTPLFFIGATLGNAMSGFIPLPLALLAGLGFVAVFSGATNTPLACTLLAVELFGSQIGIYAGLACVMAYLFSGHTGIYSSQVIGHSKHLLFGREEGSRLSDIPGFRKKKK